MATQTTDALSMVDCAMEVSIDCTAGVPTWTDVCGSTNEIAVSGGDRQTADEWTFCGEGPITLIGKKNPFEITLTTLYTETTGEAWVLLYDEFQTAAGSADIGVRWSPAGGGVGDFQFTACGILLNVELPQGAAADGAPITATAVIKTGAVTRSTIV